MTERRSGMIAVTGAAGFIGSNIVWELNRRGRRDLLVVDVPDSDGGDANLASAAGFTCTSGRDSDGMSFNQCNLV